MGLSEKTSLNPKETRTIRSAIEAELAQKFSELDLPGKLANVVASKSHHNADFQCNSLLQHAQSIGQNPRTLAKQVSDLFNDAQGFDVMVAGPGFLNFTIWDQYLANQANTLAEVPDFFAPGASRASRVVIDYGGPNIAKEMHVGHLRSALIGQALSTIFRFYGHEVTSDVHLGDWGLQMGLVIAQLEDDGVESLTPDDLRRIYPAASKRSKTDQGFLDRARQETALLQAGDPVRIAIWEEIVAVSTGAIQRDYERLGISFDLWHGESRYQKLLPDLTSDLLENGIARMSDGACVIFLDVADVPPLLLKNSNGSFGYAATDLAAIYDRVCENNPPDEILYVVDHRQTGHFKQVFSAADKAGFCLNTLLEHIPFGTINGNDGKPFRTREGGTMRLWDLLEFMKSKAEERLKLQGDCVDIDGTAEKVAIAAINYGELSHDRETSYVFDPDRFLQSEGNTGPYLLYTSVRASSLLARGENLDMLPGEVADLGNGGRDIVILLDAFPDAIERVVKLRKPNILAAHLYSLSNAINAFYQKNPVLTDQTSLEATRSYLALMQIAKAQLDLGLKLLGMQVPKQM